MDRNDAKSTVRKHSDSVNFRQSAQHRQVVSNSDYCLVLQRPNPPNLDCGSIVASRRLPPARTCRPVELFARRSTRRVSALLAGLLACAASAPGAAIANAGSPASRVTEGRTDGEAASGWIAESGTASWYAATRHSRRTASGARYNQHAMTAAHPWLPFGTQVRVTRQDTGHSIVVTITDRLPSRKHVIDLSVGAAKQLGMLRQGTTHVELTPA